MNNFEELYAEAGFAEGKKKEFVNRRFGPNRSSVSERVKKVVRAKESLKAVKKARSQSWKRWSESSSLLSRNSDPSSRYGVVSETLGTNQFRILGDGFQSIVGVACKSFNLRHSRISKGDVVLYHPIDARWRGSKGLISGKFENAYDIEAVTHYDDFSSSLYQEHLKLTSQSFLEAKNDRFDEPLCEFVSSDQVPTDDEFGQLFLKKVSEHFLTYLKMQPKTISVIIDIAKRNQALANNQVDLQTLLNLQHAAKTEQEEHRLRKIYNSKVSQDRHQAVKNKKKKSNIGFFFVLFSMEMIHQMQLVDRLGIPDEAVFLHQELRNFENYLSSAFDASSFFGKLIRLIIQYGFFHLLSSHRKGITVQDDSCQTWRDQVCQDDILLKNIIPFLTAHEVYQFLFGLFTPSGVNYVQKRNYSLFRRPKDFQKFVQSFHTAMKHSYNPFGNDLYNLFNSQMDFESFAQQLRC